MGRELRMVPADWQHPRDARGNLVPLFDEYERAVKDHAERWPEEKAPDQADYMLTSVTTMIGSDPSAQIRLTGWFKPKNAAALSRDGDRFSVTPMGGTVSVNGRVVDDVMELASGDRIDVSGVVLDFRLS